MISVIIICQNERHAIRDVIRCIEAQDPPEQGYEIVIACNKSTDGTEAIVDEFPHTRLFLNDNYFTAALHNTALKAAKGDIIFFLDGHMMLQPNALRAIEQNLRQPDIAGVCGYYWAADPKTPFLESIRDLRYHAKARKARLGQRTNVTLDTFYTMTGGIWALRRYVFEEVGGYDHSFLRDACEDLFVEIKALNSGYTFVYDPTIRANHYHLHANVKSFLYRGCVWEPRGLARLIQRAVDGNYRLPYDNYVIQVPFHTTGLLLVGLIRWCMSTRRTRLLKLGILAQAFELLPFFTACRGFYSWFIRIAAAGYWLYVNVFRVLYCLVGWVQRFAPYESDLTVTGEIRYSSMEIESITVQLVLPYKRKSWFQYWKSLLRVYGELYKGLLRKLPLWLYETIIPVTHESLNQVLIPPDLMDNQPISSVITLSPSIRTGEE